MGTVFFISTRIKRNPSVHKYAREAHETETGFIDQYLAVTNNSVRWPSLGFGAVRKRRSYPRRLLFLSRSLFLVLFSVSLRLAAACSHRCFISFYARSARYCFPPFSLHVAGDGSFILGNVISSRFARSPFFVLRRNFTRPVAVAIADNCAPL